MRLNESEVTKIVQKLFITWKFDQLMTPVSSEGEILLMLEEIFLKNLQEEDALNIEVQEMLDKVMQNASSDVDSHKMFQMLKKQLIKDRKLVI